MKPAPTAEEIAVARRWVPRFVEYLSGMGWEGAGCLMSLPAAIDAAEARAVAAEKERAQAFKFIDDARQIMHGDWGHGRSQDQYLNDLRQIVQSREALDGIAKTAERERDEARAALPPGAIVVADTEETVERIARALAGIVRPLESMSDWAQDRYIADARVVLAALREARA